MLPYNKLVIKIIKCKHVEIFLKNIDLLHQKCPATNLAIGSEAFE